MRNNDLKFGEKYTLNQLKINSVAEIVEINISKPMLRKRLFELGLTRGAIVTIKKIAPLGDPICFEIRGYELGLRKEELKSIVVRLTK